MARHFLKLKLTLTASAFKRGWQHALGLVAGVAFGLPAAAAVSAGVALSARTVVGPSLLVLIFAALAVAWTLAPVLFFGLDETLDPARLRLLPLSRRQLLTGLSVAAAVGVPAVGTLAVLGAGLAYATGLATLALAALAVVTQFLVCLWAGRALATALSATLRSRKGRDLAAGAAMLAGLVFAAAGQLPNLLVNVLDADGAGGADRLARVLDAVAGWVALTPPGWAAGSIVAAADGRLLAAVAWLAAAVALAAALGWAWQAALERTLSQPDTASSSSAGDRALFPAALGWLPRNHATAAAAKELRYLLRVPQLRVGLAMIAVFGVAMVIGAAVAEPLSRPEIVYGPAAIAALQGFQAINLFGHDRGAVWLLVAAGSTYRADIAGKGAAHVISTMAVVAPTTVLLAAVVGGWSHVVPAILLALALQLSAHAAGAVASVLAPYPMPEGVHNLWGSSAGMGCATMLLQLVAVTAQGILLAPAIAAVAAAYFLAPGWVPAAAAVAAVYGAGLWAAGVVLASARLDARAPEFVTALSAETSR